MSQIRSFDEVLDFYPETKRGLATKMNAVVRKVVLVWQALREGHAAASRYQQLRGRGLSHEAAATRVFGFR